MQFRSMYWYLNFDDITLSVSAAIATACRPPTGAFQAPFPHSSAPTDTDHIWAGSQPRMYPVKESTPLHVAMALSPANRIMNLSDTIAQSHLMLIYQPVSSNLRHAPSPFKTKRRVQCLVASGYAMSTENKKGNA